MVETVHIEEFLRTGKFGEINFGITRNQLERTLGKTEWLHFTSKKSKFPSIYKYGLMEFYFDEEEKGGLYGIQVQLQTGEAPSQKLKVNYGFVIKTRKFEEIKDKLNQNGIQFHEFIDPYDDNDTKRLKTQENVILIFGKDYKDEFILHKINKFVHRF